MARDAAARWLAANDPGHKPATRPPGLSTRWDREGRNHGLLRVWLPRRSFRPAGALWLTRAEAEQLHRSLGRRLAEPEGGQR